MFANFTKFISDLKLDCKAGYKAVVFGYDTATSATDEQIPQVARLLDLPLTAVKVGRTAALVSPICIKLVFDRTHSSA